MFSLYVLLVLQAMAALASSKEADWNAMRLRLANITTTVIRLLTLVTVCTTVQNENEPCRIFFELNDKNLDVILSLN